MTEEVSESNLDSQNTTLDFSADPANYRDPVSPAVTVIAGIPSYYRSPLECLNKLEHLTERVHIVSHSLAKQCYSFNQRTAALDSFTMEIIATVKELQGLKVIEVGSARPRPTW